MNPGVTSVPPPTPHAGPDALPDPKLVALLASADPTRLGRVVRKSMWLLVLIGLGALFVAWRRSARPSPPKWVTAEVSRADIQVTITATGTLSGLKTVEVGTEVSGKIIELHADFNDHVKRGQLLAVIDPQTSKSAVDQASAQLNEAAAAIRTAKATREETRQARLRAEEQFKLGLVAQRELEAARAAAERADAQVASAAAAAIVQGASLSSARVRLEKTSILSPIDGLVLARLVELGQTVTAGFQTPIMFKVTEDLTRMQLTAYIDEADVGRAKEGQSATFTVDAYPNRTFDAVVLSVRNAPRTEQNVVSYESILSVENKGLELRPGMTATATILAEKHERVLTVPSGALRFNPPNDPSRRRSTSLFGGSSRDVARPDVPKEPHVWLLLDGKPSPLRLQLGASDGTRTEVTGNTLIEGAAIVVDIEEPK